MTIDGCHSEENHFAPAKMKPCLRLLFATIVIVILSVPSIFTPIVYRVIDTKFKGVKRCTKRNFSKLIHLPLSIKLHDNVNISRFERSGCFVIDTSKSGLYRIIHERNFANFICNATERKFLSDSQNKNVQTAIASIPGSGNTWTRHLLEEVTGIYTGSIYNDKKLKKVFPGEYMRNNVIAVKTHLARDMQNYSRAILVVRDPFESALAEYNRRKTLSHVLRLQRESFNKTRIYTGSIYNTTDLKKVFPGESIQRNMIAVKTHSVKDMLKYDRAILVVLDPFESALSEYNRPVTNQTDRIKKEKFHKKHFIKRFVKKVLRGPSGVFNVRWIKQLKGDILVLFYDKLKNDLLNSLTKILRTPR